MVDRQDAEGGAEAADVGLPLAADIEQAGVEGDGHGEAGEHEVCGVVEGVADGEVIAKGAVEDDLHREHRVDADEPQDDAGDEEGERDVDERDQRHVDPARDPAGGRAHSGFTAMAPGRPGLLWRASSSLAALAILRPSIRRSEEHTTELPSLMRITNAVF